KRGLENSLGDARHWHDVELQNLGSVVAKLEAELNDVRSEIEQQRHDYDVLLSNRQRLEQDISLYHGILDGEENRFLLCGAMQ
ncbi:Phakinin, partial [Goodea atripinnis]